MILFEFPWNVGSEKPKSLRLTQATGAAGAIHLELGDPGEDGKLKYFHLGQAVKTLQGWRLYLASKSELTGFEVSTILEKIEEWEKQNS